MTDDKERTGILLALQALLDEFYSASCSNERKRAIEEQLTSFSRQSNACDLCLSLLPLTRDPFVLMFLANLIEGAVQRSWPRLMSDEKILIRRSVTTALLATSSETVVFVRNKLCKVLVDIGKFDWPHFYPDFFNNIFQLINNRSTRLVGVLLLRTTSEEFIAPKDDLCATRKKDLRHLLTNLVPQMLTALTGVLDEIVMSSQTSSSAPSPYPTHPSSVELSTTSLTSSASIAQAYIDATSGTHLNVESHLYKPGSNQQLNPHKPLDASSRELALACLGALEQLTSWVSIGSNFGPSMLNTLFGFIWLGCGERADVNAEAAVAAVSVINELVYKKCFTQRDTQACLVAIFENTFRVLQLVTQTAAAQHPRLQEIDPLLVTKLGELLHILIENHFSRFPDESSDSALVHFVNLVQAFTLGLQNGEQYLMSLDTWLSFFENIGSSDKTQKYKQLLGTLLNEVMSRVMTKDHPQIQQMSTDGEESEWETHLSKSLQVVSKISELMVEETCVHIISVWESSVTSFENGQTCTNEQCKDLSTLARTIGCLAFSLSVLMENCINAAQIPVKVVGDLLRVVRRCSDILRQNVDCVGNQQTSEYICQIERECFASIQSYLHLVGASISGTAQNEGSAARQIINQVAEVALEVCVQRRGASGAASGVLMSLTAKFRFPYLMEGLYPKLVPIIYSFSYDDDIVLLKNCAISLQNICLLPWAEVAAADQKIETRKTHYEAVVQNLLSNVQQSNNNAYQAQNGAVSPNQNHLQRRVDDSRFWQTAMVFEITTAMVEALSSNCTGKSKAVVADCFEKLLEASEELIFRDGRQIEPEIGERVMAFYKACFQTIPSKLDRFIDRLLETTGFAGALVTEARLVSHLEGFLGLLQEILLSPSKGSLYLRRILYLALELWPRTVSGEGEMLRPKLIQLLHHILAFHWRYFFPTNVAHLISATGSPAVDTEVADKSGFVAIMQAYGWCLVQQTRDIVAFGEVLRSLQELNNKWKLYKRPIFENLMMVEFLSVLMRALLAKSHELFRDEILQTVFSMSLAIGMERFQEGYMPQFVSQLEGLSNHQKEQLVRDFRVPNELASFSESLNSFFTDIRYFHVCNQALPPFSIAL